MTKACCSTRYPVKLSISLSTIARLIPILLIALIAPVQAQYQSFKIKSYSYAQFSSSDQASIDLYGSRGNLLAILVFLPVDDPNDLPAAEQGLDGIFRLYYKRERLDSLVDQLRNESPLVLNFWTGSGGQNSHLATMELEPVGEGE